MSGAKRPNDLEGPLAKKPKVEVEPPTVFTTPGTRPDLRFKVFNREFHVHSVILRVNSAFFRKFLDPINLEDQKPASGLFTYEWYTKIEDDGSWCITSKPPEGKDADISKLKGNPVYEERAFRNILCALFNRQYQIVDCNELIRMTRLADYLCCLPIVSSSVYQALFTSPGFIPTISRNACALLEASYKLRHKVLFKEAFIHVLGPWSNPKFTQLRTTKLKHIACKAKLNMESEIARVHHGLVNIYSDPKKFGDVGKSIMSLAQECRNSSEEEGKVLLPLYYNSIYHMPCQKAALGDALKEILDPVLKSNLVLEKSKKGTGEGKFRDHFLCIDVEEFPWDESETDCNGRAHLINTNVITIDNIPSPIVFTARGLAVDTRLKVFDTEFHVHPVVLKLHSHFFFKFLDSADKAGWHSFEELINQLQPYKVALPQYYRNALDYEKEKTTSTTTSIKALTDLMSNKSTLSKSITAGSDEMRYIFWCTSIIDEELPWDESEEDCAPHLRIPGQNDHLFSNITMVLPQSYENTPVPNLLLMTNDEHFMFSFQLP
ncbi:hypothetical protein G7Y89_g620 [Cudoniella acicularis]|uniref:BTB domain-containing protein n=1 Tax=Cudoniella acicularis TaxID=354080 RepID=A0A8H4RYT6_9HELO|nr:hypothetical protein G7Y89_g620 [Cudoniella acicularis]